MIMRLERMAQLSHRVPYDETSKKHWYDYQHFPIFWRGFGDLMHHPWFQRLWTLQEAVLAQRLQIEAHGIWMGFELLQILMRSLNEEGLL